MSDITFPKGQGGAFASALTDVKWHAVHPNVRHVLDPVDGPDEDVGQYLAGVPIKTVMAEGVIETSTPAFAVAQTGTFTAPGFTLRVQDYDVVKDWQLDDVSAAGDAEEKNWLWYRPDLYGRVRGVILAGGPVQDTQTLAMSFEPHLLGTFTGNAKVRHVNTRLPLLRGGAIRTAFGWIMSGAYGFSGAMAGVFGAAVVEPPKDDVSVDLDTGETITHSALLHQLRVFVPARRGGATHVRALFTFDKPAA